MKGELQYHQAQKNLVNVLVIVHDTDLVPELLPALFQTVLIEMHERYQLTQDRLSHHLLYAL
jgi:hypothetical protein